MIHRRTHTIVASLATIAALTLGACSSDKAADNGNDESAATNTNVSTPETDGSDAGTAEVPSDVCALFDNAAVSALLGEDVVGEATPSGGCKFNGSSAASPFPVIEIVPLANYGDLPTWQASVESVLSAPAEPITIAGNAGFIVNGAMGDIEAGQGALQVQNLLVQITVATADVAQSTAVMTGLFEMVAASL
jgi:hypothetical protein